MPGHVRDCMWMYGCILCVLMLMYYGMYTSVCKRQEYVHVGLCVHGCILIRLMRD